MARFVILSKKNPISIPKETQKHEKDMILVVMMCLSIVLTGIISAAEEKMPFTDVKESKWFYGAVQYVYTNGLMNGKSETKFAPNEVLTRAQFAKMLWSLAGEPATEANLDFADTKNTQWYAESLTWAVGAGIVNGYEEGGKKLFKPNKEIFRDELAKMLVTFLDYMDIEIVGEDIADPFPDKIQNWAKDFVEAVRLSGLMKGKDGGRFEAKATATRAEGATILMRMHPYVSGGDETTEPDVSDPETTEPDVSDPETTEPETTPPEETEPLVKVYPDDDWKSMDAPADDPTPENIGTVYSDETIGLMISEAMKVDDNGETVKIAGTGIHGGHEVKVARTRYGTFAIFVSGDNAQEGRTNDEMSFFEITANGTRRIFKDDFDHSNGSCVPNILQGENGILYIILMNEDWSKSSARLTVYTYDAKTDTYTKDMVTHSPFLMNSMERYTLSTTAVTFPDMLHGSSMISLQVHGRTIATQLSLTGESVMQMHIPTETAASSSLNRETLPPMPSVSFSESTDL